MTAIRVFVVEDEGIVAMDLFGTLRRLGYELVGNTTRGEDVLELVRKAMPDVILMDIRLAGEVDGIEAARQVRAALRVPVIFLTAYSDETTLARARTVEPYGYIMKPFDDVGVRTAVELAYYRNEAERERGVLEAARRENERLAQLNDLRARFVSMASHELNTPLTPLRINLRLLADSLRGRLDEKEAAQMESLERNVLRLSALVKDLLDAGKLQSGSLGLSFGRTDVAALAAGAVAAALDRARRDGVLLSMAESPPAWAEVDGVRVAQILANLLDNACKFTPRGGRVSVSARATADAVEVEVRDTGVGLAPGQAEAVFQPFATVHDPATVGGQGSGLGLYVSRGLAEGHGGTLACRSEGPGRGATFILSLPKAARQAGAPAP